jgi:PAS domain S-box-containing protein
MSAQASASPTCGTERSLASLFAEAATGVAVAAVDGTLQDANAAYCRMVGYTLAELRTMRFWAFTHPDDLAENERMMREAMTRDPGGFNAE